MTVVMLWMPYEMGFSLRAQESYREPWNAGVIEQPLIDLTLAAALDERRELNRAVVRRLSRTLAIALASLVIETGGLALEAFRPAPGGRRSGGAVGGGRVCRPPRRPALPDSPALTLVAIVMLWTVVDRWAETS